MKHVSFGLLVSLFLLGMLAACGDTDTTANAPEGTVAVNLSLGVPNSLEQIRTLGVPYNPDTGESGVQDAELRVFRGDVSASNDALDDLSGEVFFDGDGNIVAEAEGVERQLSKGDAAATLFLPAGQYTFVADASELAIGVLAQEVEDGAEYLIPMQSFIEFAKLTGPGEIVANEIFDLFLEASPKDRPDLRVPASDYEVEYVVEGDATIVGQSSLGVRLAANCNDIKVIATLMFELPFDFSSLASAEYTIPANTACEGVSAAVDLHPPFVTVSVPEEGAAFEGPFFIIGEVNDMQSGVARVEVYDGPILLGEAELDTSTTPAQWGLEIDPDTLRDYTLTVLAYDNAGNEGRTDIVVSEPDSEQLAALLQEAVTVENVRAHQKVWQDIADANGGNRFAGFPGYELSADYVYGLLEEAGYEVSYQEFDYSVFLENSDAELQQITPSKQDYVLDEDFGVQTYSGSGDVTAAVTPVDLALGLDNASSSGCEPEDFVDFPSGNIALMQRGACTFASKAENAEAAGAVAAIIFNQGNSEDPTRLNLFGATLGEETTATIPVLAMSYTLGETLANTQGLELRLLTDTRREDLTTRNVIAETVAGDPDNIVMLGAHLDSVLAGPGIQDNGSGSAGILEIALQLPGLFNVNSEDGFLLQNKVRFAWWSAEESGLIGSTFYVDDLVENDPEAFEDIALYLNFDMIGSPNFFRGIYDGDQSDFEAPVPVPDGSAQIERVFEAFYEASDLAYQGSQFSGRSDYQAFINNGIPAGGLFTGAEGIKTEEEVAIYGGTAGEQYDPCYHEECDTFDNISLEVLDQNVDAIAYALATFAANDVAEQLSAPLERASLSTTSLYPLSVNGLEYDHRHTMSCGHAHDPITR